MDHRTQKGFYQRKQSRSNSEYIFNSVKQNRYRNPSKKTYVKKQKSLKYRIEEFMNLQNHAFSKIAPASQLYARGIIPIGKYSEAAWRLVPKMIKSDLDSLTKNLKSLLNKLTPTNLEPIQSKLSELINRESSKVFSVLLLNKACMEFKYNETYCQLAKALISLYPYFREDLLLACQSIFESNSWESSDEALSKKKMLGLVGFIGELMNARILSSKVLVSCCELLLKKNNEYASEGVCYLLSVCTGAFSSKYKELAHNLIRELQERSNCFSSRLRFQVMDLVESNKIHSVILQQKEKPQKLIERDW